MNDFVKVPPMYELAFFNQRWVQEELGVPLNYTSSSNAIVAVFLTVTGDPMVGDISTLESVLSRGVNVAVASGDRDYRCNWIGAENVTLAMDLPSSNSFRSAGYAPLTTNSSYQGGLVREHGNLSFSRIFQAGHGVSAYQPETMYRVFERALSRRDVATGEVVLSQNTSYATEGPLDVMDVMNEVPEPEMSVCYFYGADISCTEEQRKALADGTAMLKDFVVVEPAGTRDVI
ncbi:serine-type carboxypeptidase Z precursor [Fusarium albosuccineum]|uniref:Serine-type carboxypeptidase Z n=1 Tax=Fusarium albosuccineum TaxID=1237068 RepID=A0A8H4P9R1_9HYPO|nr:serine-type carboxypeptidase Z precursor [Fusarium albosuccineum]